MPGAYPLQLGAVRALDTAREKDLAKSRRAAEAQRQWRGLSDTHAQQIFCRRAGSVTMPRRTHGVTHI
jgi:hypothetical protein